MSDFRVASRYAKSLLALSIEDKIEDKIKDDMQLIADTCQENRSLVVSLKNPIIKYDKKLSILKKLFGEKVQELTIRFVELLSRKNRADIISSIATAFLDQYNEYKNIIDASVTSASPLSGEARKKILEFVKEQTNKEVILKEDINKDLIGGFVLRIKDNQLDNSVSGQLNQLKRQFLNRV